MATDLDIANLALDEIGGGEVTSITSDTSSAGRRVARYFPMALVASLEKFDWSFASTRSSAINAAGSAPKSGFEYRFPVPGGCVKLREVMDDDGATIPSWVEEGGYILCNDAGPIYVRFTAELDSVVDLPLAFAESVAYRLAAFLASPHTSNPGLRQAMLAEWARTLSEAMLTDGKRRSTPQQPVVGVTATTDPSDVVYVPDSIAARE